MAAGGAGRVDDPWADLPGLAEYEAPAAVPFAVRGQFVVCQNGNVYHLRRTLAQSNYGRVAAACVCELRDDGSYHDTDNLVALKIMSLDLISRGLNVRGGVCTEDPLLEIRALSFLASRVRSPHLVGLHEVLQSATDLIVVLEFVPGGELFDRLDGERLPILQAHKWFRETMLSVAHCHAHHVTHRDVSIENVLIDGADTARVIDMGYCAPMRKAPAEVVAAHEAAVAEADANGDVPPRPPYDPSGYLPLPPPGVGKVRFMAPEVFLADARGEGYFGVAADIWSCGVTLFQLVCGVPPYETPDPGTDRRVRRILQGRLDDLLTAWRLADVVPEPVKELLRAMLSADPLERPTAMEVLQHGWVTGDLAPEGALDGVDEYGLGLRIYEGVGDGGAGAGGAAGEAGVDDGGEAAIAAAAAEAAAAASHAMSKGGDDADMGDG